MFLGSSGVAVFEHECSESGSFCGLFSNIDHNCKQEQQAVCGRATEESCCKMAYDVSDNVPMLEEECCSTEVSLLKVNDVFIPTDSDVSFNQSYLIAVTTDLNDELIGDQSSVPNKSPPKLNLSIAQQRARLQVYLI